MKGEKMYKLSPFLSLFQSPYSSLDTLSSSSISPPPSPLSHPLHRKLSVSSLPSPTPRKSSIPSPASPSSSPPLPKKSSITTSVFYVSPFEQLYNEVNCVDVQKWTSLQGNDDQGFEKGVEELGGTMLSAHTPRMVLWGDRHSGRLARNSFDGLQCETVFDTSYEKACGPDRRGSAPATPILGTRLHHEPSSNNRFMNFFNKRSFKNNPLKRTKSVTKLERTKRTVGGLSGTGSTLMLGGEGNAFEQESNDGSLSRLRASRSHESLLGAQQQMMHTLDMAAGEVTIRPLHPSVLGQDYCFQITSPSGVRYYSCRNGEERDKWVESLRRAVNPHADRCRRTENSLKIFVLEAKRVAAKKKYFCELQLDGCLYARTSSKAKGELCFWGEQFEFKSLPPIKNITVTLYREGDRRRKKEKSTSLGSVTIPVSSVTSVTSRSLHEKWYSVSSENSKTNPKDQPSLRIKCKFQSVEVLPLELYSDFLQHVKANYFELCSALEPNVNVKAKEEIGTTLVHIMQKEGLAKDFLADLVMMEIDRIDDAHLLFRGNSLATKAMEAFMKLVGEKYLHETLEHVVNKIVDDGLDCEVDRTKVAQINTLQKHQENLIKVVRMTWTRILNSHTFFPRELKQCFCKYRQRLEESGKGHLSDNLISASIFLRFLCPAILSPSLFSITQEYPDERTSRNLTLIAKTLQTLANFTKFQGKENFMEFMNEFIEKEQDQMRAFLKQISTPDALEFSGGLEYEGEIDIGVQLSILHTLLSDAVVKMNGPHQSETYKHLDELQAILDKISTVLKHPNINIVQQMSVDNGNGSTVRLATEPDPKRNGIYQSLQRNIFRFNDPTVDQGLMQDPDQCPLTTSEEPPPSPRSSTLPRTSLLLGSGRKPAADLSTADDYVLFSALNSEGKQKPNGISHSRSHSHIAANLCVPSKGLSHHQHFHNHTNWYNNWPIYEQGSQGSMQHCQKNSTVKPIEERSEAHNESTADGDTNMKGSQTSISQLSNVASSGYQSFAYSQSSSPVDPSISHDVANNNVSITNAVNASQNNRTAQTTRVSPQYNSPLAFNNPMYHLNSSPRSHHHASPYTHHAHPHSHSRIPISTQQQSPVSSSLSSSHSIEDIPMRTNGRGVSHRAPSTSSEDNNSLTCTPPVDHRFAYKSTAPRTNPRYGPPTWGSMNAVNGTLSPEHHRSTSDLVGPIGTSRRPKTTKRPSTETGSSRRPVRRYDDSDSSSDDQVQSRTRPMRHQRLSETKTLDEYEKEILALQSSMEMQLKLVTAQEKLNGYHDAGKLPPLSSPESTNGKSEPPVLRRKSQETLDRLDDTQQMRELLKSLIASHDELVKEQQKKAELMSEKDAMIMAQEERIAALHRSNTQLLRALGQLKAMSEPEGAPAEPECTESVAAPPSNHLRLQDPNQLSDTSDYKSCSC